MLVELKTGETYNGRLVNCDAWMNLNLREVICTSRDGNQFWKLNECYIRGSSIKYLRLPEDAIDRVPDESEERQFKQSRIALNNQGGRAGGRGRGRGSGRGDGRGGRTYVFCIVFDQLHIVLTSVIIFLITVVELEEEGGVDQVEEAEGVPKEGGMQKGEQVRREEVGAANIEVIAIYCLTTMGLLVL